MIRPNKFLKEDFEREREVILEEYRRNLDSPYRQIYERLFSLAFKQHPYRLPVIGNEPVLKKAKVSDLEKFYRQHYVAPKMALILAGPLSDPKVKGSLVAQATQALLKVPHRSVAERALKQEKIGRAHV